jgi:hypothetical protein
MPQETPLSSTPTLTRRDAVATALTGLSVFAFLTTHEGWGVPLIGDSHRWAAVVILALGLGAATVAATRLSSTLFTALGVLAVVFGVLALATGSLTPLSLLVIDLVVAWAIATWRHAHLPASRPVAA